MEPCYLYFNQSPWRNLTLLTQQAPALNELVARPNEGQLEIGFDLRCYSFAELCSLFSTKNTRLQLIIHDCSFQVIVELVVFDVDFLLFDEQFPDQQKMILHYLSHRIFTPPYTETQTARFLSYCRDFKLNLLGIE